MTLTKKIALYFLLLGLCLALGSYVAIRHTVIPAFEEFEADATLDAIQRVSRVLDSEILIFETMLVEYAHWNDTYNFVLGKNQDYIRDISIRPTGGRSACTLLSSMTSMATWCGVPIRKHPTACWLTLMSGWSLR
jgi:hypothetical protein